MFEQHGTFVDTDILVIGAGGGGLLAALSAKRNGPPGTRVSIVDSWNAGHTGHTAFSNAWTVVVEPDDDLEAVTREIIAGNDWVADQPLIHRILETSYDRLKDQESVGLNFQKDDNGRYIRRHTRGLDHTRVMYPDGGGLECRLVRRRRAATHPSGWSRARAGAGGAPGDGERLRDRPEAPPLATRSSRARAVGRGARRRGPARRR